MAADSRIVQRSIYGNSPKESVGDLYRDGFGERSLGEYRLSEGRQRMRGSYKNPWAYWATGGALTAPLLGLAERFSRSGKRKARRRRRLNERLAGIEAPVSFGSLPSRVGETSGIDLDARPILSDSRSAAYHEQAAAHARADLAGMHRRFQTIDMVPGYADMGSRQRDQLKRHLSSREMISSPSGVDRNFLLRQVPAAQQHFGVSRYDAAGIQGLRDASSRPAQTFATRGALESSRDYGVGLGPQGAYRSNLHLSGSDKSMLKQIDAWQHSSVGRQELRQRMIQKHGYRA